MVKIENLEKDKARAEQAQALLRNEILQDYIIQVVMVVMVQL